MKKILTGLAVVVLCARAAFAAFSSADAGTAGAAFLKLGAGARPAAMGSSYTGAADDSTAVYWNPAGLARISAKNGCLNFMHAASFEDISYDWVSYARPVKDGVLGIGAQYLSYGDITTRNASGAATGSISPSDLCATLSYARHILGLDAGASLKYISSEIRNKASAVALDAGAQYALSPKIALGAVLQNMGSSIKYDNSSDPLPLMIKAGAAYHMLENWALAGDVIMPSDGAAYFAAGTEYTRKLGDRFAIALRGGYNTASKDLGGTRGFALGLGLKYGNYSMDYAYVPMGELGNTNKFSVGVQF